MPAALLVATVLVEARSRRRQQDDIARFGDLSRLVNRFDEVFHDDRIIYEIAGDPFSGGTETDDFFDAAQVLAHFGHVEAFFIASDQEDHASFKGIEGRDRGVGIGSLGVVVGGDALERPYVFDAVFNAFEGIDGIRDIFNADA